MKSIKLVFLFLLGSHIVFSQGMAMRKIQLQPSFTSQYRAIITYANANSITIPNAWDQANENNLLKNLIRDGVWSITDQLFAFPTTGDLNFGLINWKAPGTRNATYSAANAQFWEKGVGYTNSGTGFIKSNYTPSTNAVNLTQNNTGAFIRIVTDVSGTGSEFGAADAAAVNFLGFGSNGLAGQAVTRLNTITNFNVANATTSGNYAISRSGATTSKLFKNGSQDGSTNNVASTGLTAKDIYIGTYNNNGASGGNNNRQIGFYSIGSNLDAVISAYNTDLNNFLSTSKAVSIPSFASKGSITDFVNSASLLSANFQYGEFSQKYTPAGFSADYFDGALAANGFGYCSPGSATVGLKINATTGAPATYGSFAAGTFKYGGAAYVASTGMVYFTPASSTVIAKVNTATDAITFFDTSGVKGTESGNLGATIQKWYGAFFDPTGRYIFCIPYNATAILVIDTSNDSLIFIDTSGIVAGPTGNLPGAAHWDAGGIYGQYGYGGVSDAIDMLKFDMTNFTCQRILTAGFPVGTSKWSLGLPSPLGRYIYFFPYFRNDILKYDTQTDTYTTVSSTIGVNNDSREKIAAARLLPTGNFLLLTSDAALTNNYIFNPSNDTLIPFVRQDVSTNINGSFLCPDGSVQAVPQGPTSKLVKYYIPHRTMTLPDNFTDNNFAKGY